MPEGKLPLELRLGLRAGSVFYFEARELSSIEPHFFVVVNRDPLGQDLLLLTVFTSKVENVRRFNRTRQETVVEFGPTEYPPLSRPTAIDGNFILRRSLREMAHLIQRNEVRYHEDFPPELLQRLRVAILASPVIDEDDKDLIR